MKKWLFSFFLLTSNLLIAQQDQQLFFMHYLGESNFMNPAVQSDCPWFIGIPIFSSIHLNYANSVLAYHNAVRSNGDGTYTADIDRVVNHLGRRSFVGLEFHTTLFAIGHRKNYFYYNFSAIEKVNIPATLPRDAVNLLWKGNTPFEGAEANLRGTSAYVTHYREYAIGISKYTGDGNYWGVKAKLLFGKLNVSLPKSNIGLSTDDNTFDLSFHGKMRANLSAPIIINHTNGTINSISRDESVTPVQYILNRKNPGFAVDLGFIHPLNENLTLSGSALDIGFIRWRSNLNNISSNEEFLFQGVPPDSVGNPNYLNRMWNSMLDSVEFDITNKPFFTALPAKFYLGLTYKLGEKLDANGLLSAQAYKTKLMSAATLMLDYSVFNDFHVVASYSLMYRSFNNFGLGITMGRGPLQFYIISDNAAGIIWPLYTRNINLRFGLNINLGCNSKGPKSSVPVFSGVCKVYDKEKASRERKSGWRKSKD